MRQKSKKYYLELFDAIIDNISGKPKILLQACCAPCSSAVLELLADKFEIDLFFNGHNIYPYEEYEKRLKTLEQLVEIARNDFNATVNMIVIEPQIDEYMEKLAFGADQREGGSRCSACYSLRMKETLDYARAHNYKYVSTVMTISRQKCSEKINNSVEVLMPNYPEITYVYSDFKKRGGNSRSSEICRAYDLYQQNYCGCLYSYKDKLQRESATIEKGGLHE